MDYIVLVYEFPQCTFVIQVSAFHKKQSDLTSLLEQYTAKSLSEVFRPRAL